MKQCKLTKQTILDAYLICVSFYHRFHCRRRRVPTPPPTSHQQSRSRYCCRSSWHAPLPMIFASARQPYIGPPSPLHWCRPTHTHYMIISYHNIEPGSNFLGWCFAVCGKAHYIAQCHEFVMATYSRWYVFLLSLFLWALCFIYDVPS